MAELSERLDSARNWTSSLGLGMAVISLYILLVGLVFVGFASYIVRADWQAQIRETTDSEVREIDTLVHLLNREANVDVLLAEKRDDLSVKTLEEFQVKAELNTIDDKIIEARSAAEAKSTTLFSKVIAHAHHLLDEDKAKLTSVMSDTDSPLIDRARLVVATFSMLKFAPEAPAEARAVADQEIAPLHRDLLTLHTEISVLNEDRKSIKDRLDVVLEERSLPKQQFERYQSEQRDIIRQIPVNSRDRATYNMLSEIGFGEIMVKIVALPTIFLTLIVTIASGGLGSVVSFSRRFNSGDASLKNDTSARRLFVNVGEGIAAAIAIFLLSGAGLLALSTGASNGVDQIDLSPYAVAFVAFVSGFMAEDAFAYIQNQGKGLFKVTKDQTTQTPPGTSEKA